jgi:hypothetical protein
MILSSRDWKGLVTGSRRGDDARDLLVLVEHLADGEHHLLVVAVEGRYPGQVVRREIFAGQHRDDAGDRQRRGLVDLDDARVRIRAVHQRHPHHPGQREVVEVLAVAADEARVFLALHAVPHRVGLRGRIGRCTHRFASYDATGSAG